MTSVVVRIAAVIAGVWLCAVNVPMLGMFLIVPALTAPDDVF